MMLEAMNDEKAMKMVGTRALSRVKNFKVFQGTIDWVRFGALLVRLVDKGTPDDWWAISNLVWAVGTPAQCAKFEAAYARALVPDHAEVANRAKRDRKTPLAAHIVAMQEKKEASNQEILAHLNAHGISSSRDLRLATGLKSPRLSCLMMQLLEQKRVRRHDGYFQSSFGNGHGAGWEVA